MNALNPELIRYARKYNYFDAEGFNNACIGFYPDDWEPELLDRFSSEVAQLAEAAGIKYEIAQGALVSWTIEKAYNIHRIEKGTK